ncbi:hypothetical protein PR001_g9469 [Phytophthora rubi]|uniref:Uncharacterized protein n=1 Tax=Phytophthora rubi TaxID=129364 RepID=A0A6A3N411_9STRA|nr:hypothetical protein PR002_g10564 [Phytophthora rubi]KAE9035049.1 hypothetical protein PR001_g9469 [Phytophthora rubi]
MLVGNLPLIADLELDDGNLFPPRAEGAVRAPRVTRAARVHRAARAAGAGRCHGDPWTPTFSARTTSCRDWKLHWRSSLTLSWNQRASRSARAAHCAGDRRRSCAGRRPTAGVGRAGWRKLAVDGKLHADQELAAILEQDGVEQRDKLYSVDLPA